MTTSTSVPRMNLWRLEWLRLIRTPRAISLAAIFAATGLIEPVLTRYESTLVRHLSNGARISLPPPTAADGLNSYVSEAALVGLIVVVILASGAFTFDSKPGLATFLRTRVTSMWQLITPRFTAYVLAAAVAYLVGTLAAWYETRLLLGPLPVAGLLEGVLCAVVYMMFAVAITALAASFSRSTIATAGIAFVILLALPLIGTIHAIQNWLPSALVNAPADLVDGAHGLAHFGPAIGVAAGASALALAAAAARLSGREI
jgi:ABC-2 type transport system permease protein